MNTTKEGIEVKAGQIWKDLDKRMCNRHCIVKAVDEGKAHLSACRPDGGWVSQQKPTKVSIARMHKSSTGWELVKDAA